MTEKQELKILRQLLWKIGNACIGYNDKKIEEIISEIRYGYCYGQSNSYEGQTDKEVEDLRISSLKRLEKKFNTCLFQLFYVPLYYVLNIKMYRSICKNLR